MMEGEASYLQRQLVPLARLVGLRATDEGLHVVGLVLEHVRAVADGAVKVAELLVAGRAVAEALEGELGGLGEREKKGSGLVEKGV